MDVKFVQFQIENGTIYALDDGGKIWKRICARKDMPQEFKWIQIENPAVPRSHRL